MSEARREIEAAIGDRLTVQENAELYVLMQGGATLADVLVAVSEWKFARHVRDDWEYLRGAILENAALRACQNHPRLLDEDGNG